MFLQYDRKTKLNKRFTCFLLPITKWMRVPWISEASIGFTLIELSIVLIIVGLLVGGILVGKDLIDSAAVRAQVSQIENYRTVVNAFRDKYGYLPGDIPDPAATSIGLKARGTNTGEGDGNGLIQSSCVVPTVGCPWATNFTYHYLGILQEPGNASETTLFWSDLSLAKLIPENFTNPTTAVSINEATAPALQDYFPRGKISKTYILVWSGGITAANTSPLQSDGINYFSLGGLNTVIKNSGWAYQGAQLTVLQAFDIDNKIDDGKPQSGKVSAFVPSNGIVIWSSGSASWNVHCPCYVMSSGASSGSPNYGPTTTATSFATTNCYDNNGVVGDQKYQLTNAILQNCALSFKF